MTIYGFTIFFYLCNTPVSVVRKGKIHTFAVSVQLNWSDITYCESVFRKSFSENVEVFLGRRMIRTALTFV